MRYERVHDGGSTTCSQYRAEAVRVVKDNRRPMLQVSRELGVSYETLRK